MRSPKPKPKTTPTSTEHSLYETSITGSKLNWLRAAVLGANDGIVSISGLVIGIASATETKSIILFTGIAGIVAGAISMAAGEYVSVSSQRDSERALLAKERWELKHFPKEEFQELIDIYVAKGLSHKTAIEVAKELTDQDAFAAHVDAELGIDPDQLTNPWHAAFASCLSFLAGAIIPLATIVLIPAAWRIQATFIAVLFALTFTGFLSARVGHAPIGRAIFRVVAGGAIAMIVTFGIGKLFGISGI